MPPLDVAVLEDCLPLFTGRFDEWYQSPEGIIVRSDGKYLLNGKDPLSNVDRQPGCIVVNGKPLYPMGHDDWFAEVEDGVVINHSGRLWLYPFSEEMPGRGFIGSPDFSIKDEGDYRVINGVHHHGSVWRVKLAKDVFRDKKNKVIDLNQDGWVNHNLRQTDPRTRTHGLVVASGPWYLSIFDALYQNRSHPQFGSEVERARQDLEKVLKLSCPMTMSRNFYGPENGTSSIDRVLHDYGMSSQYEIKGALAGKLGFLEKLIDADEFCKLELECLAASVVNVADWLAKRRVYVGRGDKRAGDRAIERVLIIGVDVNCFGVVDCYEGFHALGYVSVIRPALGVDMGQIFQLKPFNMTPQ